MTCLDSTFLIELLRGSEPARIKYGKLRSNSGTEKVRAEPLCTTIVNAYELAKGAMLTKNPEENLKLVHELLSELVILELDLESVDLASKLYSELSARGKLLGEFDILIASICMARSQSLVTNDSDFASFTKLTRLRY